MIDIHYISNRILKILKYENNSIITICLHNKNFKI